jgi:hypothetical protein
MLEAINGMQHVMQQAAHFLLSPPQVSELQILKFYNTALMNL